MKIYIENYNLNKLITKLDLLDEYFINKKDVIEIYCEEGMYLIDDNKSYKLNVTNENVINKCINNCNLIIDETVISNTIIYQIPHEHIAINNIKFYYGLPSNVKNINDITLLIEWNYLKNIKPINDSKNKYEKFIPNNFYFEFLLEEKIDDIVKKEFLNVFLSLLN